MGKTFAAGGAVLGALAVFYFPLVSGRVLFFGDNYNLFAPVKSFFAQEVLLGHFPLWNPYLFSGTPFLADINYGLLSPLNFPFFFLAPLRALTASALVGVAVFGLGVCWWMRGRRHSRQTAAVIGILSLTSGSIVAALNNLSILQTVAWFPILIGALERGAGSGKKRWFVLAGPILALAILGGHPQFIFGLALTLPLYLLLGFAGRRRLVVFGLVVSALLALGLSAIQLVPFYEFTRFAHRPVGQVSYYASGALPKVGLVRLILPWFFGLKSNGTSWAFLSQRNMGLASGAGYLGLFPLLLIGWRILRGPVLPLAPGLAPGLLMLAMSFGSATALLPVCGRVVPFCRSFRNPEQYLFFWTLWLLPVAADSLESFSGAELGRGRFRLVPIGGAILLGIYPRVARLAASLISGGLLLQTPEAQRVVEGLVKGNLLIVSLLALLAAGLFVLPPRLRVYFAGLLFFLDLFLLGRGDLISAPWAKVKLPLVLREARGSGPQVKYLSEADVKPYGDLQTYWNQYAVREPLAASRVNKRELTDFTVLQSIATSLPVNLNLLARLPSPDGYGSLVLSNYAAWFGDPSAINSLEASLLLQDTPEAESKREALGVKYLIGSGGRLTPIAQGGSPAGNGERVRRVSWYPGWRAYRDGREIAVSQDGGVFQSVKIPKEDRVRFVFDPLSFKFGLAVSMISGAAWWWLWRAWR